jgi:hemerythrin
MALIKFGKDKKIGIKIFDEQHKEIIQTVNHLFEIKESPKEEVIKSFDKLLVQLKNHFESEEKFMKDKKIIQYISHKLEHDRALQKYSDYFRTLRSSKSKFDPEILISLKNWLDSHLIKKDSKLKSQISHN